MTAINLKQIHTHTFLVLLTKFSSRKLLSSISKNKFPLIIYIQQQFPFKGENDQHFLDITSPTQSVPSNLSTLLPRKAQVPYMSSLPFSRSDGTAFSPITQGGLFTEGHPNKNDVLAFYMILCPSPILIHTLLNLIFQWPCLPMKDRYE